MVIIGSILLTRNIQAQSYFREVLEKIQDLSLSFLWHGEGTNNGAKKYAYNQPYTQCGPFYKTTIMEESISLHKSLGSPFKVNRYNAKAGSSAGCTRVPEELQKSWGFHFNWPDLHFMLGLLKRLFFAAKTESQGYTKAAFFKLECDLESLLQMRGHISRVSEVELGWVVMICIWNKFPDDADAGGPRD